MLESFKSNMSREFPNDPIALTQKLIQIPSDKTEGGLVGYMNAYVTQNAPTSFRSIVLETAEQYRPSLLVANHPLPRLVIVSHIDTTPAWVTGNQDGQGQYDPYGGTIVDGMLYGRGSSDAKSAAAAMLTAISRFKRKDQELDPVALAFTSDEETRFGGIDVVTKHFARLMRDNPGYQPEFIFSTNGSNNEISYGCRGLFELDLEVSGKTGHSGIRKKGSEPPISAYDANISAYLELKKMLSLLDPTPLGKATLNNAAGQHGLRDQSGNIIKRYNSVPDIALSNLEIRTNGGFYAPDEPINGENTLKILNRLITGAGATIKSAHIPSERAAWVSEKAKGEWLENIVREVTGLTIVPEWNYGEHGFDEIAILMNYLNRGREIARLIPGVIWGVGIAELFHKPDECVRTTDIKVLEQVIIRTLTSPDLRQRTYFLAA